MNKFMMEMRAKYAKKTRKKKALEKGWKTPNAIDNISFKKVVVNSVA